MPMFAEAAFDPLTVTDPAATPDQSSATVISLILWILVLVYLLPTLIVLLRRIPSRGSIIIINLFAGFTLWGWVTALALACRTVDRSPARPVLIPASGWFLDPFAPARLRYFDGVHWTGLIVTPALEHPQLRSAVTRY